MQLERNSTIDVFKGICITLMVLGHAWAPFVIFIYMFHIPAFFVASGYTYRSGSEGMLSWIKKKFLNLMLPFLLVNLLFIAFYELLEQCGLYGRLENADSFMALKSVEELLMEGRVSGFGGATWFLPVLFLCSVIYRLLDMLGSKTSPRLVPYFGLLCFALGWLCIQNGVGGRWYFDLALLATGFFAFGRILAQQSFLERDKENDIGLPFLASAAAVCFFYRYFFENGVSMNWPARYFDKNLFMLLLSCAAAMYVCWRLAVWLERQKMAGRLFIFVGKRTYAVLAWHFAAFKLLFAAVWFWGGRQDDALLREMTPPYQSDGIAWLLYSVAAIGLCMLWSKLAEKWSLMNYVVNAKFPKRTKGGKGE